VVNDEGSINKYVKKLFSAIQEVIAESAPKRRPRANPRPPIPARIKD
jgi:hypothetical protein